MLSSRSDIFFNVQGQRHIVRSKLLYTFWLERYVFGVYANENNLVFTLYVCKCVLFIGF